MKSRSFVLRWTVRGGIAAGAIALAGAGLAGVAGAQNVAPRSVLPRQGVAPRPATNPYSPANGHPYRHGVVPTTTRYRQMARWVSAQARAATPGSVNPLNIAYGGGVHRVGVIRGPEKVYLVFWGSQWGAQSVNGQGDVALAGDPSGEAVVLQQLFKGLGTGHDRWSGVLTQYCDGVKFNALTCPSNSWHVGYPKGGALAGVWVDESAASPANATGNQLGAEAVAAASHFGNATAASNANAQYVILSPTGTHPDGFNTPTGQFCAWHDDTADPNLPEGPVSSTLDLPFTNMPYVTDMGPLCGQNFVNAGPAGLTDGVSIVEGHEYAETSTDKFPPMGWLGTLTGAENGDLCAWGTPNTPGGTNDLTLPTGTFAMQSTWSNDSGNGRCAFSHPVITNNWVANGGFESGTLASWTASGSARIVKFATHSGTFSAQLGRATPTIGDSNAAQTFTANATNLSFWYNVKCAATVSQSWATATITDNTTHTTATLLSPTCQANSGWQQVTDTLVAGHSYTLTLTNHDAYDVASGHGTYTLFDDVVDS